MNGAAALFGATAPYVYDRDVSCALLKAVLC